MATLVFPRAAGYVAAIRSNQPSPMQVSVDGLNNIYSSMNAIVSQMAVERQGNLQFMHTFGDLIYAYIFGERIGQVMISGLAFSGNCQGGNSGLENILQYYDNHNAIRSGEPLNIAIGRGSGGALKGFLTGCNVDLNRPEWQMAQFSLRFNTFPRSS